MTETAHLLDTEAPPLPSANAALRARGLRADGPLSQPTDPHTARLVRSDRRAAAEHHSARRRVVQCIAWPLVVAVVCFVLLVVLLQWPAVHHSAMQSMRLVHTDDGWGMPMDYDHISGLFPWRFTMHGLRVVDPTGRGFTAGEAIVRVPFWRQFTTLTPTVSSVTIVGGMGTQGDGYVEDNSHINAIEHNATEDWAARNAREKTWPKLPRGLVIENLVLESLFIPELNRTVYAQGSVKFLANGGSFDIAFAVGDDRGNNVSFTLGASASTRRVRIQATLANSTEPCKMAPGWCGRSVSAQALFPTEREPFQLPTAAGLSVDVSGSYGGLLQAAFPSKRFMSAGDLLTGTLTADFSSGGGAGVAQLPLLSSAITVFHVSGNRTLVLDEVRLASPLLSRQGNGAFLVRATLALPAKGIPQLLSFHVPEQRLSLPLPLGESDVALQLDGRTWDGVMLMRKYDALRQSVQWTLNGSFALQLQAADTLAFAVEPLELGVALGHMRGQCTGAYTLGVGLVARADLFDSARDLSTHVSVNNYQQRDGARRAHYVGIEMTEPLAVLGKLHIEGLRLQASVFDIPFAPYGNLGVDFGRVDYDSGVFVMNNATLGANRAAGPLDSTPWELTASSNTDLRTRFTLMLVGNGENEFRGTVAPFDATLYGRHRVWTSEPTRLSFNYQQQEFSLNCGLHANEAEPERVSLDVNMDTSKMRLMVNDASYLLDPLLFKPRLQTTGLLQGYIELASPLSTPYLGAVDMCWNDGTALDSSGTQVAHNVHGCVRGNALTGWSINNPPAMFYLDSPRLGPCALRANISAVRRPSDSGGGSVLDLPVQAALRMLDPDASQLFENGWVQLDAWLSMKL